MRYYDSHNHLQDPRLKPVLDEVLNNAGSLGIVRMVVNGVSENDWDEVVALSKKYPIVIPSIGLHPWYVKKASKNWLDKFNRLVQTENVYIGEIGLDGLIKGIDFSLQQDVFIAQLTIASEMNLPVSLHCVKAFDKMMDILRATPVPERGFIIHSYGGSADLINPLTKLGAYFSLPGYFANERKVIQRETFKKVPLERLLIETDAPDQLLPDLLNTYPLSDKMSNKPLNHPFNLLNVYRFASELLQIPIDKLCEIVEQNFQRVFLSR